jgi:methylthioribose-1-phosphate isomerase
MRTVSWKPDGPAVRLIDQRKLPAEVTPIDLDTPEAVAEAIRDMAVRGAPAIGAAAAYALALAAATSQSKDVAGLWLELQTAADLLRAARPTAVNLGWCLDRMLRTAQAILASGLDEVKAALLAEAEKIADEDVAVNQAIGRFGAALLPPNATVIHHCNTGALATVDWGTALGVIRTAHESGQGIYVLVDETRPRLQGARLTAWELQQYGIPFEIIVDGAAGYFLQRGPVAAALVGADRVAANGDVANKIGTYMLALAARDNQVPFYVAVPTTSIDLSVPAGEAIPIELRPPGEVLELAQAGQPVSPPGSHAQNPAFDITPYRLVTAFITEVGVIRPPFETGLSDAVQRAGTG